MVECKYRKAYLGRRITLDPGDDGEEFLYDFLDEVGLHKNPYFETYYSEAEEVWVIRPMPSAVLNAANSKEFYSDSDTPEPEDDEHGNGDNFFSLFRSYRDPDSDTESEDVSSRPSESSPSPEPGEDYFIPLMVLDPVETDAEILPSYSSSSETIGSGTDSFLDDEYL